MELTNTIAEMVHNHRTQWREFPAVLIVDTPTWLRLKDENFVNPWIKSKKSDRQHRLFGIPIAVIER